MKKLLLLATAAGFAGFAAAPAFADASGTVNVNGSVAAKCNLSSATPQTINVGELAQANGTVVTTLPTTTVTFAVECTSANPGLTLSASPMSIGGTPPTGYTGTVHYTATLQANAAGTDPAPLTYATDSASPNAQESVGGPLKNPGAGSNITIGVSLPHTATSGALLEASTAYTGAITFTVSPS